MLKVSANREVKKKAKDPFVHVISGACSGILGACVVQPLDVVRTRQQLSQFEHVKGLGAVRSAAHLSSVQAARFIIKGEGAGALWNGLAASIFRVVPGAGMYFGLLHAMSERAKTSWKVDKLNPWQSFLVGSGARLAVSGVLHPISVVKTRMEGLVATTAESRSVLGAFSTMARNEGLAGMFSGFYATVLRDVPTAGLYLAFYDMSKNAMSSQLNVREDSMITYATSAVIAGVGSTILTHPPDVIKTKLQMQVHSAGQRVYHNSLEVIRDVWALEGVSGFYKGLVPRLVRKPIMFALTWTTYEMLIRVKHGLVESE